MKVRRGLEHDDKVELNMTSMIDIVFQLLIFFIMTFKIVVQEGDFSIRMPADTSAGAASDSFDLPLTIELSAYTQDDLDGKISKIVAKKGSSQVSPTGGFPSPEDLHEYVDEQYFQDPELPAEPEAVLKIDPRLKYSEVIKIVTAISGKRDPDDPTNIITLFEKIRFQRPD